MVMKKEADGEHAAEDYLVVGDALKPSTWRLRVRDAQGKLDHRLMGAAWAAQHSGFRGRVYAGPERAEAIRKLEALYRSEGMALPHTSAGEVSATGPQFVARLADFAEAEGADTRARIPVALTGTWARGGERFSITRRDLENIAKNFRARRNGEINVDYDHASEQPEVAAGGPVPSAGRIVGLDEIEDTGEPATGNGTRGAAKTNSSFTTQDGKNPGGEARSILWGWYEPTERARKLIRNREYRYISPAIDWGARSKRSGKPQGATLTSVALTNRPFLEELPEIRLSDPAFRLIDTGSVHVETSLPDEPVSESRESGDSREETGGNMKKVKVRTLPEERKIAVVHPDFADEYYAEPEDLETALAELGIGLEPAISVNPDPESITLSEASALSSETQAQGKTVAAGEFFRARVEQAVEDAARTGKILPRQRDDWRRIALADFATFTRLMSEQKPRVPTAPIGIAGGAPTDAASEVRLLAEQRMRERGVSFGQALSEIGREQPRLVREYRRSVSAD